VNRIAHLLLGEDEFPPRPEGPFTDIEALNLLMAYRRDPSDVPCPTCGPGKIEVLAFIDPQIDPDGSATICKPEGSYAVAVFCHACRKAIGLWADLK
jgi:hypothetical protein